jgi:hypothetical protein
LQCHSFLHLVRFWRMCLMICSRRIPRINFRLVNKWNWPFNGAMKSSSWR